MVPVTFAVLVGRDDQPDRVVIAIDAKPKSGRPLKRLANIAANSRVSIIVDHYDDTDWSQLWWVRADGTARVVDDGPERTEGIDALRTRYAQYCGEVATDGPLIVSDVDRWSGWSGSVAR